MPFAQLHQELETRAEQGLLRRRRLLDSPQDVHLLADGKPYLSFCSNDYLGLANDPRLVAALQRGSAEWGVGSGASHLVSGHFTPHHELEVALAKFVGKPKALLFSTGYLANLGVVQALVGRGDGVFADKLNHASLNDAMLLSRAEVQRYRHNDVAHLASLLDKSTSKRKLVITDAVFSMDGDLAPLPELLALCEQHDAWLLVDDAHGFGVLGKEGRGALAHFFPHPNPPYKATSHSTKLQKNAAKSLVIPLGEGAFARIIYMATLGKAAGISGAFVAAEPVVIDTLVNQARSYIYTTASSPALSVALLESLNIFRVEGWRRERLQELILMLRAGLADLPWKLMSSATPIQPLLVGSNQDAVELSDGLRARGILVPAIRPPTVPQGTARLRISLSAAHTEADVNQLIEALHELARESKSAHSAAFAPSPSGGGLG